MGKIIIVHAGCCKESSERLGELLKCPVRHISDEQHEDFRWVINYGSSSLRRVKNVINNAKAVKICKNKISTLKRLSPVCSTIEWTKEREQAKSWLVTDGVVVARQLEEGNQGKGLVYIQSAESFETTHAKFYTRYFWHTNEVRVNVFKNKVISVYDKVVEGDEFTFVPLEITGEHPQVTEMISAIQENIGIDFYGMDILFSGDQCKLLEVNSGAILHPQTERALVNSIKEVCK